MDYLIYCITIEETAIKLVNNSLGYCVCISEGTHTHIVINSSLGESLDMMQYVVNLLSNKNNP